MIEWPTDRFQIPETFTNERGDERHVGFEFEYTGISIGRSAELIAQTFDGEVEEQNPMKYRVKGSRLGEIRLESDLSYAEKIASHDYAELPGPLRKIVKQAIREAGEVPMFFIPWEIVTDPLRPDQFYDLEALRTLFFENRARGTSGSLTFAFGTHINPEAPSLDVETLLSYLKAFVTLYPELKKGLDVNPSRRILSFVSPFPRNYAKLILDPGYSPDIDTFIDDYLKENNTRNRALDLLPLLVEIKPEAQLQIKGRSRHLVKPRPAFHYRLPNCDFGNPSWTVASTWNSWAAVENLAQNQEELKRRAEERLKKLSSWWGSWFSN